MSPRLVTPVCDDPLPAKPTDWATLLKEVELTIDNDGEVKDGNKSEEEADEDVGVDNDEDEDDDDDK